MLLSGQTRSHYREMRKDPVTRTVRGAVLKRDLVECYKHLIKEGKSVPQLFEWKRENPICLAPVLDPSQSGRCSGRETLDHVKDQPMMGKRAPSDPAHLVTLCWHHHLDGWATSHRPELRDYLREVSQ